MPEFVKVAKVKEVPPGKLKAFEVNGNWICLANIGSMICAVDDTCTHMQVSLAEGEIVNEDGKMCVMCSEHASLFDLKTGAVVRTPANGPLKTYDVKIEGDDITVSTEPRPAKS